MMEEIGILLHIVLLTNGFHEIEKEPFGHFSECETCAEQSRDSCISDRPEVSCAAHPA